MTAPAAASTMEPSYRSAGWAAILSGLIGLISHGFAWAFVLRRATGGDEPSTMPLIRAHDAGVILQSLFLIPVVFAIDGIVRRHTRGASRGTVGIGVASLSLIILCLLLVFANVLADDIYTVPQGWFGIWIIVMRWRVSSVFPRSLTWLGMVVGVGLVLVATFPFGYRLFVDSTFDPVPYNFEPSAGTERANAIIHNIFIIGSFMGVTTLPIWSALLGRQLLKMGRLATASVTA